MAHSNGIRALVVTVDKRWRDHCVNTLINAGCDVDTASKAAAAFDLCQKIPFDLILLDDSLPDYGPIESVLTVRDVAQHNPAVFVGGDGMARFDRFWARSEVAFAGNKSQVPKKVLERLSH